MFDFHSDKKRYFNIQKEVTHQYVMPFLKGLLPKARSINVMEIGCGEAGVLSAFLSEGHKALGVELVESRAIDARNFLQDYVLTGQVEIINKNIYDFTDQDLKDRSFDLVILKDVIEHIPNQQKFIPELRRFLSDDGLVFFAYPPWWMPFGGHQQVCRNRYLRLIPWIHLLPSFLYRKILQAFGEKEEVVSELLELKETGIIIESMHQMIRDSGFTVVKEKLWFTNPIYKYKFGLPPRAVLPFFRNLYYIRNLYTTAHYIVFKQS